MQRKIIHTCGVESNSNVAYSCTVCIFQQNLSITVGKKEIWCPNVAFSVKCYNTPAQQPALVEAFYLVLLL